MTPRSRAQVLVAAGSLAAGIAGVACLPTYTFGRPGGDDAGLDATSVPDATSGPDATSPGSDASPDASSISDGSIVSADAPVETSTADAQTTFTLGSAGSSEYAVGYGYQLHLVYAQTDGRYWLFYADGTAGVIKTRVSADLVTWSDNASIALTPGYSVGDGYAFSVAYANVGGADVVHVVENSVSGGSYESFHIRATIAGGTITASAPVGLADTESSGSQGSSGSACVNDGPSAVVAADGHVWDVTAWTGHSGNTTCDTNIYVSPTLETGAPWDGGAFLHDGYYVSLPSYTYCHQLVSLPDAGVVMIAYPDEDNVATPLFDSIGWALSTSFSGGGPGTTGVYMPATSELFNGTSNQSSLNDWAACRLSDGDVHVVRHVTTAPGDAAATEVGAFEEVAYNGAAWGTRTPPTAVTGPSNSGLALIGDTNPADGMLAAVIGSDQAIHLAKYSPTTQAWTTLPSIPGTVPRQALAGTGCGSARPIVFYTEGSTPPYAIRAADLSGLLGP